MCGNRDRLRVNARIWQRDRAHEHPFHDLPPPCHRHSNALPTGCVFQPPITPHGVGTPPWDGRRVPPLDQMEASERDHDDALRTPTHMEGVRKRRWRSTYHAAISGTDRTTVLRCTLNRGDHDDWKL